MKHETLLHVIAMLYWKVGAAISMAYTTGRPIFFIGTGQRYVDFKRINVKKVIHSLLL